jgi:type IV secretion system protein VirB4
MTHANKAPWFTKAGAANGIVPISHFVGPNIFALKGGGYGCLFSLEGVDPESCTGDDLNARTGDIEASLRGLPQDACLYQYTRVRTGFTLPRQPHYDSAVTESFAKDRLQFLGEKARFRRIDLYWCLTVEPDKANPFNQRPKEHKIDTDRQLFLLEKAATILEAQLIYSVGLKLLSKDEAFPFFSYLFNLEEWAPEVHLRADTGVDRQIAGSPVEWHSDYLRIGRRYVQMFSLINTPETSRPCLFANLMELECDSVLCMVWRAQPNSATQKEVTNQEKFLEFFKLSPFQRLMSGKNTAPLETTASAKAVIGNVESLTEVVASLDKLSQGDYALRLLLSAGTVSELRSAKPTVHRLFVDASAPIIEETFGNLSAFYAMFPGNRQFNVYPLWLREDHHARLSSIFTPHLGHTHSEDLDSEYLNIFETRTRTPYFQDVYVNGVRVQLIIGPTGTGKSVHANQMLSLEQKYRGFTFIFDIGAATKASLSCMAAGLIESVRTALASTRSLWSQPGPTSLFSTLLSSFYSPTQVRRSDQRTMTTSSNQLRVSTTCPEPCGDSQTSLCPSISIAIWRSGKIRVSTMLFLITQKTV